MSGWSQTLADLRLGDIEARDRVARLVIGVLKRLGAYEQRDSWDDVVQDVLVTLLDKSPRSNDDKVVAAWVRKVTTHCYVDRIRKEHGRRRGAIEAGSGWRHDVPLNEELLPDEAAFDVALEHDLAAGLAALSHRKRQILKCKYSLGCTDAEGAAKLEEAVGTYKRLLNQALVELRALLLNPREGQNVKQTPMSESKTGSVPSRGG
jgi:RNA polymerase sigma factor (sigma-70 family)